MSFDVFADLLDSRSNNLVTHRRSICRWFVAAWAVSVGLCHAASPITLQQASPRGTTTFVQAVVEVNGDLKLNADGKEVKKMPFQVRADLKYEERLLEAAKRQELASSVRYYEEAKANLRLGDTDFSSELSEKHRSIAAKPLDNNTLLYSPGTQITRDELDLIDIQGNSTQFHRLLPAEPVEVGGSWKIDNGTIGAVLGLETVIKSEITAEFKEMDGDLAIIELKGTMSGAVGGVTTEIELDGKCNFDTKAQHVAWLALHIKEDRAIGHAEPGFNVEARVRVAVARRAKPTYVKDDVLTSLAKSTPTAADAMLAFSSDKGGFRLIQDRGWRTMVDRHDVTVMRLIQRGDLVAQCNVSKLPPADKPMTLANFQKEVQTALGKNFGQIAEATESRSGNNLRVLRIVATGVSSELPIEWIYYHVSNDKGRRAALVFTLEAKLAERFGGEDQTVVESFQFQALDEPTPARDTKEAKKDSGKPTPARKR